MSLTPVLHALHTPDPLSSVNYALLSPLHCNTEYCPLHPVTHCWPLHVWYKLLIPIHFITSLIPQSVQEILLCITHVWPLHTVCHTPLALTPDVCVLLTTALCELCTPGPVFFSYTSLTLHTVCYTTLTHALCMLLFLTHILGGLHSP